jgi:hypothetical protein
MWIIIIHGYVIFQKSSPLKNEKKPTKTLVTLALATINMIAPKQNSPFI